MMMCVSAPQEQSRVIVEMNIVDRPMPCDRGAGLKVAVWASDAANLSHRIINPAESQYACWPSLRVRDLSKALIVDLLDRGLVERRPDSEWNTHALLVAPRRRRATLESQQGVFASG